MNNCSFYRNLIIALSTLLFISCDTDYNEIGANITDSDLHSNTTRYAASVTATDAFYGAVQSNNLPVNSLGIYDNPVFGKTIASFVSQVELSTANPTLTNPVIDSVYLYVPYFSTLESTDADGVRTYSLDSIYGNTDARFRLRVYENNYFLRDTDPSSSGTEVQRYFSDEKGLVENNRGTLQLNNDSAGSQNESFFFNTQEVKRRYGPEAIVAESFTPGMFLYLDKDFFQQKILNGGSNLQNNNVFREYFRGLYFQVEQIDDQAVMGMPRFDQGTITIKYTDTQLDLNGDPVIENGVTQTEKKSIVLNLKGNTINFFDNVYSDQFATAVTSDDGADGDERLYVKGGAGSLSAISILSDEDIATLQAERVLINEANLIFYVDQDIMANAKESRRVYLYDLDNKRPLVDFALDATTNTLNPKLSKVSHGGILEYDSSGRGIGYKVRLTNHVSNIINKDSTNVKLGLVVTENINVFTNANLKMPLTFSNTEVTTVPVMSVVHPFGTVLYGTNSSVPQEKRLKLEIYYTKPD